MSSTKRQNTVAIILMAGWVCWANWEREAPMVSYSRLLITNFCRSSAPPVMATLTREMAAAPFRS